MKKNKNKDIQPGDNAIANLGLQEWINITEEKPEYYAPVDIFDGIDVHEAWARVSDGETEYYVNSRDNKVIPSEEVIQWKKRPGIIYRKYDPMITDDTMSTFEKVAKWKMGAKDDNPILSPNDVKDIIIRLNKLIEVREQRDNPEILYIAGLMDAIAVIEGTLKDKLGNVK